MAEKEATFLKSANIVAFAVTVLVNSLAGTGLINGVSTAEVSDKYANFVTPAGYVFTIWGVIYILLAVFVIFQALPSRKGSSFHRKVGFLFVLSCILNITWIFLWQYDLIVASVVFIFLLLATLVGIYTRVRVGKSTVSLKEKLAVHLPFSVYFGWITVASLADVSAVLVATNKDGFGTGNTTGLATNWATAAIIGALVVSLLIISLRRDVAYGLVFIWALVGIAVKQNGNHNIVIIALIGAAVTAAALAVAVSVARLRHR